MKERRVKTIITSPSVGFARRCITDRWKYETTYSSTAPDTADRLVESAVRLLGH
jgi:hypothetical protein